MISVSRRQLLKLSSMAALTSSFSVLSGCQPPFNTTNIRMGVSQSPRMLDPRKATDALSSRVNRLIYQQLVDFNESFEAIPSLATWQKMSSTHYQFTLKHHPVFHHGKPLDASDVVATYLSVLDNKNGSPHRGSLKHIKQIIQVSDRQVDFILTKPDALFAARMVIGILPKDLLMIDHPFHRQPVGTGACEFVSRSEQKLVLNRLRDQAQLEFIPVKDPTVRVLKLIKGEIDWLQNDLSPELLNYCQAQSDLVVKSFKGNNYGYVGFNFSDPFLTLAPVRQAIAHGINRQAIIDGLLNGEARLAAGLLVPEHWAGAQGLVQYEYDPEKARALLDQVKQSHDAEALPPLNESGQFELSFKTSSDPTRIRMATIYQSQLKRIGIDLKVQSYDWGTFYGDIKKGNFQLYSLAWVGVKSPDIFQYVYDSQAVPPNGANRGRFKDQKTDELIEKALNSDTISQQSKLYQALQARLHEKLAVMPLWYENQYTVHSDQIKGYQMYADGRFDGILQVEKQAKS